MCLYPDVQKRAQAEVDSIIGNDRLPMLADRPRLSFLDQLISEVMRWSPPAPLGLPHSSSQNSRFDGYHIPQGCTIFANIWEIFQLEVSSVNDAYSYPLTGLLHTTRTFIPIPTCSIQTDSMGQ